MKKLFIAFALTSALFSCKKETTNSTTNTSNGVTCVDNPNINFTSIGTPVGKFSDCIKDVDGNVYKTVTIGTQTWMAENLKTSKYNDGTPISNVKDSLEWSKLTTGAWSYYGNDEKYNATYGKLYNWYVVGDFRNVCPVGWHVPSDLEFEKMISILGGDSLAGGKMKEIGAKNWVNTNPDISNLSLFSGIPSGGRIDYGGFDGIGNATSWWSSTRDNSEQPTDMVYIRYLTSSTGKYVMGGLTPKRCGNPIRCIKD